MCLNDFLRYKSTSRGGSLRKRCKGPHVKLKQAWIASGGRAEVMASAFLTLVETMGRAGDVAKFAENKHYQY